MASDQPERDPDAPVFDGPPLSLEEELAAADLVPLVAVDPEPADGTNVEIVVPLGETTTDGEPTGTVRMRVQERGAGETRSCGTGACAVAVALRRPIRTRQPVPFSETNPGRLVA